jgi:hypothetical protein
MQFKMVCVVRDFVLVADGDITVEIVSPPGRVQVHRLTDEQIEAEKAKHGSDWFLAAETLTSVDLVPPDEIDPVFQALAQQRLPDGLPEPEVWVIYDEGPTVNIGGVAWDNGSMPVLWTLPEPFQAWAKDFQEAMREATLRVINLIRWRCGLTLGSHNPLVLDRFLWSLDGHQWWTVPWSSEIYRGESITAYLANEVLADVQQMELAHEVEPFAHVLLREAWEQRLFNPRSAILLAVAAAEVGLKQAISILVPDATYLVEKVQTPPMADLLKNYFPMLPVRLKINESPPAIPPWVRSTLDAGVQTRNKLAHRPLGGSEVNEELRFDKVTRLLQAVQDLLVLLDFFTGHSWAIGLLSRPSQDELGLKTESRANPPSSAPVAD